MINALYGSDLLEAALKILQRDARNVSQSSLYTTVCRTKFNYPRLEWLNYPNLRYMRQVPRYAHQYSDREAPKIPRD
jgi:hypothetical protein